MTRAILSCSPLFSDAALNEFRRQHPEVRLLTTLVPGILLIDSPGDFAQISQPWLNRLPVYLHHLFPLQQEIALPGGLDDLSPLQRALRGGPASADVQLWVAAADNAAFNSYRLQEAICQQMRPHPVNGVGGPLLSILIVQRKGLFYACVGLCRAGETLSPWPGGRFAAREPVSNRAGYKLLEALASFRLRLRPGEQALDLGAAPARGVPC